MKESKIQKKVTMKIIKEIQECKNKPNTAIMSPRFYDKIFIKIPEKIIQKKLLDYAELFPHYIRLYRRNLGAKGYIKFGKPGMADVTGFDKRGLAIEIECKNEKGKLSLEQEGWAETCKNMNVSHYVVRSIEEAYKLVDFLVERSRHASKR